MPTRCRLGIKTGRDDDGEDGEELGSPNQFKEYSVADSNFFAAKCKATTGGGGGDKEGKQKQDSC